MKTDPVPRHWAQVRTGVLLTALLAAVLTGIFMLDVVLREMSEGPELTVAAGQARDLEPGSAVWVAGIPAGRVTAIRFQPAEPGGERRVVVRAVLLSDAAETMRADASAVVRSSALMAPAVVAVDPGEAPEAFDFGDTLAATFRVGQEEVMARADSLARRIEGLAPLARRLQSRLSDGPGTLASLASDPSPVEALREAADRLRAVEGGTAVRLAADTGLHRTLTSILERGRSLGLEPADGGPEDASGKVGLEELQRELESVERRLRRLEARMAAGRGSAARFLTDRALDRERRLLEARMDSVRAELLAEPLRWLRFRLF